MSKHADVNRACWNERGALHEFPYASYQMFPFLERDDGGGWWLKETETPVPMKFSVKAAP